MRVSVLVLALALASGYYLGNRAKLFAMLAPPGSLESAGGASSSSTNAPPKKLDFAADVRPIFESRCTPCHFAGGTMYARLPFDRAETIQKLGAKLFTRIKDEKEQRVIRDFLAQQSDSH